MKKASKVTFLNNELYEYLIDHSVREPEVLQELRYQTSKMPEQRMQITPDQGQFMALLIKLINAKRIIEIGTYTGYSTLAMALAMSEDGKIVACDINTEWTKIAKNFWQKAGVADKIDLRLDPACETLEHLLKEEDSFDLAFIDADKKNYHAYYELCLKLVRHQGIILIDNTLWEGKVMWRNMDENTLAIHQLNCFIHKDLRVESTILPISDGLTIVRKIS